MAFPCRLLISGLFLFHISAPATAQRRSSIDCPRPARVRSYRPAPALSLEISGGFSKPLMYYNGAGSLGSNYRFASLAIPYLSAALHLPLSDRLDVWAGLWATQTWQGLRANFQYGNAPFEERGYTGSFTIRVPVGIAYKLSPGLRLDVAPYVVYSTHSDYLYGDDNSAGPQGFHYVFESPEDKSRINFGLSLSLQVKVSRRIGLEGIIAADGGSATPSYGMAYVNGGAGGSYLDKAVLNPYLLHVGVGVCYKLWGE